jgi:hypothetical protein
MRDREPIIQTDPCDGKHRRPKKICDNEEYRESLKSYLRVLGNKDQITPDIEFYITDVESARTFLCSCGLQRITLPVRAFELNQKLYPGLVIFLLAHELAHMVTRCTDHKAEFMKAFEGFCPYEHRHFHQADRSMIEQLEYTTPKILRPEDLDPEVQKIRRIKDSMDALVLTPRDEVMRLKYARECYPDVRTFRFAPFYRSDEEIIP